jgi:hypothetical protein
MAGLGVQPQPGGQPRHLLAGLGHQTFILQMKLALGGHVSQKLANVLMTNQPDQFGQLARRVGMLLAKVEPVQPYPLKGVNHAIGMARQVNVKGILKKLFGALQNGRIQGIKSRFIHQQPGRDPFLHLPVKFGRGQVAGLKVGHHHLRCGSIQVMNLHQGANRPFQPVSGVRLQLALALPQTVVGKQVQFRGSEQIGMTGQHDAQQGTAGAGRRQNKKGRGIGLLRRRNRPEGVNQAAELAHIVSVDRWRYLGPQGGNGRFLAPQSGQRVGIMAFQVGGKLGYSGGFKQGSHIEISLQPGLQPVDKTAAWIESPPSSKKLSSIPTPSICNYLLPQGQQQVLQLGTGRGVVLCSWPRSRPGGGSALRSILPLGVSGSSSSQTKWVGTI